MASRVPGTGFASTTHWIFPGPPRVGTFVTRIAQGYEPRRRKAERPNRAMLGAGAGGAGGRPDVLRWNDGSTERGVTQWDAAQP